MSIYGCPKCAASGKVRGKKCKLCKGKKLVTLEVLQTVEKRPKRAEVRKHFGD